MNGPGSTFALPVPLAPSFTRRHPHGKLCNQVLAKPIRLISELIRFTSCLSGFLLCWWCWWKVRSATTNAVCLLATRLTDQTGTSPSCNAFPLHFHRISIAVPCFLTTASDMCCVFIQLHLRPCFGCGRACDLLFSPKWGRDGNLKHYRSISTEWKRR